MSIFGQDNMPYAQTRHKGAREGNVDYFDEIQESEMSNGSLGGSEGMKELMKPVMSPMVDGLKVSYRCTWCGHPLAPVITWSELLFLAHNLNPANPLPGQNIALRPTTGWASDPHTGVWIPILPHTSCRQPQSVGISQGEAGEALQFGLSQNLCNSRTDSNWSAAARLMNFIKQVPTGAPGSFPVG